MKKQSNLSRLMGYAGGHKILTYSLSCVCCGGGLTRTLHHTACGTPP